MKQTYKIIFFGRVQGVGFRYTTQHIAHTLPVSGFVHNRADGTVEVLLQAENMYYTLFMNKVQSAMGRYISDVRTETCDYKEHFDNFSIRF